MDEPLTLRAHQVLCLQGFQGLGYSDGFVEQMTAVQAGLRERPAHVLRLVAEPDLLCGACPHLSGCCVLQGPDHETHMRAHDERVLERLGLEPGAVLPWAEVLDRIAEQVRGDDLPGICTTCPWLPLGLCATAMDRLAAERARDRAPRE